MCPDTARVMVMGRYHEPNASHFSARYAERKMAAARADRDTRQDPCLRCATPHVGSSLFCSEHRAEYEKLAAAAKAAGWTRETVEACERFSQRTYWPVKP